MKQRFNRIEAGRQSACHRVVLALLWVIGGSVMLPVPAQAVPDCNTAEENADWRYTCYQQDGANTLQWMPLLATQDGDTTPVLKAISNIGAAANASGDYNTNGYRLPYVQELALLLGFDESNTPYNAFAAVPYMHAWFNLPTGLTPDPDARRLLSATNNSDGKRLMMSLADGTVSAESSPYGTDTQAILVRNFPAQFRIGSSGNCLTANNDKTVSSVLCSGENEQLWRYNIASGCLHPATKAGGKGNCLGGTNADVNLTSDGKLFFVGQRITFNDSYLRVDDSVVTWVNNLNDATPFTLLPP